MRKQQRVHSKNILSETGSPSLVRILNVDPAKCNILCRFEGSAGDTCHLSAALSAGTWVAVSGIAEAKPASHSTASRQFSAAIVRSCERRNRGPAPRIDSL